MKQNICFFILSLMTVTTAPVFAQLSSNSTVNSAAAFMEGNGDNTKSKHKVAFKVDAFAGYMQVPVISNSTSDQFQPYSSYNNVSFIDGGSGFELWYTPVKFISLRIIPQFAYGTEISSGTTGEAVEYIGAAKLMFGKKLKIFGEGAYIGRSGSYSYDYDASNAAQAIVTSTDLVTTASFDYTVIRYGGGLYLETSKDDDSHIELGVYQDKTSITNASSTPLLYKATIAFGKFFLQGSYSPSYPLDGTATYALDNSGVQQEAYLDIRFGAIITL